MAIIIALDGTITHRTADSHPEQFGPDGMTLQAMQAVVEGYIEHVQLDPPFEMSGVSYAHLVVNEEGKLKGLSVNAVATDIAQEYGHLADIIVGPALLATDEEFQ